MTFFSTGNYGHRGKRSKKPHTLADDAESTSSIEGDNLATKQINQQPSRRQDKGYDPNRYFQMLTASVKLM